MVLQQSDLVVEAAAGGPLEDVAPEPVVPLARRRRTAADVLRMVPAALCVLWLAVVVISAIIADWLPLQDPARLNPVDRLQGPSGEHWFGTDNVGRDIFARAVYGSRVSLIVSVSSVAIGLTIGSALGIMSGYLRGRLDGFISWVMDVILSFPSLVLLIALVAYRGPGLVNISVALGFLAIPIYARLARAHSLSVSSEEYVLAARAGGAGRARVLWREIMPNVLPSIFAYGLVAMSLAIVIEGSLSFLGLSSSIPTPSWGGLIANGQGFLRDSTSGVVLPAAVLCVTVLSLNVIGEKLRRRFEVGADG